MSTFRGLLEVPDLTRDENLRVLDSTAQLAKTGAVDRL